MRSLGINIDTPPFLFRGGGERGVFEPVFISGEIDLGIGLR